jgi:hypothetical protein
MDRRTFLVHLGGAAVASGLAHRLSPTVRAQSNDSTSKPPRSPAKGPLTVLASNPRYFTDGSGKAIYLAGSHGWWNFQDNGTRLMDALDQDPPPIFDYNAYLDQFEAYHHNFFRLWRWEAPKWGEDQPRGAVKYCEPHPWLRTGPGLARDGKPKFDLTRFNPAYFDRMHQRVKQARDRGFYVSVMLFEGWELQYTDAWTYHPFNGANNVNDIFTDPAQDLLPTGKEEHLPASAGEDIEGLRSAHYGGAGYVGAGLVYNTLSTTSNGKRVLVLQEAYVKKVIDTVNDLENLLYETCNEAGAYSIPWQYHIMNVVKEYEATKPAQHPVGMTSLNPGRNNDLFSSPADWISPASSGGDGEEDLLTNPAGTYRGKVFVTDTDHICGHTCGDSNWVWKSFCRGLNVLLMEDLSASPTWQDSARVTMGQTRMWSQRIDLAHMVPSTMSETKYCLANPGKEYLVFQDGNKGEFTVNLADAPGSFAVEWFNTTTGSSTNGKPVPGGGVRTFPTPFGGPSVLYLKLRS